MDGSAVFNRGVFSDYAAVGFGFVPDGDSYRYIRRSSADGMVFHVLCLPLEKRLTVSVVDSDTKEDYLLFDVVSAVGYLPGKLRAEGKELIEEIEEKCFVSSLMRERVFEYVLNKFGTVPDSPFENDPKSAGSEVLRCPSGKWYGIVMNVRWRDLGVDSGTRLDCINLKVVPETRDGIIDGTHFFTCYHMNKKHWISAALTPDVPFSKLCELIDTSYHLVNSRKSGSRSPKTGNASHKK